MPEMYATVGIPVILHTVYKVRVLVRKLDMHILCRLFVIHKGILKREVKATVVELGAEESSMLYEISMSLKVIAEELQISNQLKAIELYRSRMERLQIADQVDAQREVVFLSDVLMLTLKPFSAESSEEVRAAWKKYDEEMKAKKAQEQEAKKE